MIQQIDKLESKTNRETVRRKVKSIGFTEMLHDLMDRLDSPVRKQAPTHCLSFGIHGYGSETTQRCRNKTRVMRPLPMLRD